MYSRIIQISLSIFTLVFALNTHAGFVIVMNSDSGINSMKSSELKKIYLKKVATLPNGSSATVVGLKEGQAREDFLGNVLRKSEASLNSYWSRLMFSGRAQPPQLFSNDAELLDYIRKTPGAIGYVDSKAALGENIAAVNIN